MTDGHDSLSQKQSTVESARLHEEALETFPGGVSHNLRYFDPHPIYLDRAEGARVWDADGNEYVDYWMNHIASALGHAHPDVVSAVQEQAARGLHYGAPNEKALQLGQRIQEYVPSAERVRYCASGTEATMYAVRLARAFTDRDYVLKARGGWHGGSTDLAKAVHAPFEEPTTAGLPPGAAEHLLDFRVNDRESVERLFDEHEGEVAGVIVEPMLLAGGGVEVDRDFLEFLREETDRRDALLIFDEVVTGFRVSPGTYQERVGVVPDVTTLGKFLGGGLPIGALAGRADLFENARPDVHVPPGETVLAGGGTFTVNPMTATAGLESIRILEDEPVHEYTEREGERVRARLRELFEELDVEASVLGTSSLFLPHFEPETSLDSVDAVETRTNRDALFAFHKRLVDRGHYFLPGHMGAISYQTSTEQLDDMLADSRDVVEELVEEGVL